MIKNFGKYSRFYYNGTEQPSHSTRQIRIKSKNLHSSMNFTKIARIIVEKVPTNVGLLISMICI